MKIILITGVSRGIGNALAKVFLENNFAVIGTVRDMDKETGLESFENFQKEVLDVAKFASMDYLAQRLDDQNIDVLVNNAGVMDAAKIFGPMYTTEQELSNIYLVNTIAPYVLAEKLLKNLERGSEKLVVSVSSLVSKTTNLIPGHWVYGSSKSALNYAMLSFTHNYPQLKVSLVRPGWVRTDMGGQNAAMSVEESANIIFKNIINHKDTLKACTMVGPEGDITTF